MRALKHALEAVLGAFSVFLIVALTLLVLVAVVYRELGGSLSWYDEVATIMLAWLTYYGSAFAALRRGHLGSPEILAMAPRRIRLALFIVGEILVVSFFLLLGWVGLEVVILLEGDKLVSLPWVPVQFTQSVIPIGAALFVICQLLSIGDEWASLDRGAEADLVRENI